MVFAELIPDIAPHLATKPGDSLLCHVGLPSSDHLSMAGRLWARIPFGTLLYLIYDLASFEG